MNYNSQRAKNIFSSDEEKPFKLSRSKIEDFLNCPRCFYLDRKCGTCRPPGYPFTLNSAVDTLLKKEFDLYRIENTAHPLMREHRIDAIPFSHPDLEQWRMNFKGIQHLHEPTQLMITGAIDDLWLHSNGELIVVDYKATSTSKEISLEEEYRQAYKRQMEIYQWLFRKNGFNVSNTGYFVYCNGDVEKQGLHGKLEFKISLLPYEGSDSWIEETLISLKAVLVQDHIPEASEQCEYCKYFYAVKKHLEKSSQVPKDSN